MSECMVFQDGADWIVYAPLSRLAFRTNEAAARRFSETAAGTVAATRAGERRTAPVSAAAAFAPFAPTHVTVVTSHTCGQACVYCYGEPAHEAEPAQLDPAFCRVAIDFMARGLAGRDVPLHVFFHGVGEPTHAWAVFEECVEGISTVAFAHGVRARLRLCTGGQLPQDRADWIADRFDEVDISLDGPRDIQNRQRPRRDGADSFDGPLRLARAVRARGKKLLLKATVTQASVGRVGELVELAARELGCVELQVAMAFATAGAADGAYGPPAWQDYVRAFAEALDLGVRLGVRVNHPHVTYASICYSNPFNLSVPFCLAPPRTVTAFFDAPSAAAGKEDAGTYGYYDAARGVIVFDHEKRKRLEATEPPAVCLECPCAAACIGTGGVKRRLPDASPRMGPECQARLGVLRELVRRAVPRRIAQKETVR